MFTEQSFRFPDEGKKFTTKEREKPFRGDHEDVNERYKKADIDFYRSFLMAPCQENFLFQKELGNFFREDHEDFKSTMDERYKKAEIDICRSLMMPYQEKFLFQNESSQN